MSDGPRPDFRTPVYIHDRWGRLPGFEELTDEEFAPPRRRLAGSPEVGEARPR